MRTGLEIARRSFARWASYRGAALGGLFTNTVFGFLKSYILLTVFAAAARVGGWTPKDTLTYVWLTQGLIMTVFMWGWVELAERIRTGDVATDLHRPVDVQWYYLASDLGRAAYHASVRGIPPFAIGAIAFDLRVPEQAATVLAFALSVTLAVVVSFALRFLSNLPAFWLLEWRGVASLAFVLVNLLSGFVIPLSYFPEWARTLAYLSPAASVIQIPIDIFLEKPDGAELAGALLLQTTWAVVLLGAGRAVFARGARKLVIQGG